jgi:serine/threonine-protein kinase RsbW
LNDIGCAVTIPFFSSQGSDLTPAPNQNEKLVNLSIRNKVSDIAIARTALDRIGKDRAIPNKALTHLQVALDEILSNIVKYAWPSDEDHKLHLSISLEDGGIEVVITDDGASFDPRAHTPREPPPPGSRRQPGGVGIKMVAQLVDGFDYARIDGRNQVTLTKRYVE